MRRVGLIQSDGIGDIIIGLPIAKTFADGGAQVFWPINEKHVSFFAPAAPYVTFIPVPRSDSPEQYFIGMPRAELAARQCDPVYVLYNWILQDDKHLQRKDLIEHLKFDEYKYAAAGVPFNRKWQLELTRNMEREMALHRSLDIRGPYICMHRRGHDVVADFGIPDEWRSYQLVEVDQRSDSPFDWIYTLEHASKIVCIDSCFANLVEQLNLPNEKHLILRLPNPYMPVMKNGWQFIRLPEAPPAGSAG